MASADIERGRQYLKEKNYPLAVKEFKSVAAENTADSKVHYLLALSYVLMGKRTNAEQWFLLAESPVRDAIKTDPSQEKYHDLLVEIMARVGKLDKLSREYRSKLDEESGYLYSRMLEKIAAVGVLSIPDPATKSSKGKHKGYFFLHYLFIPAVAAVAAALWMLGIYSNLRNFAFAVVVLYVLLRILSGVRVENRSRW